MRYVTLKDQYKLCGWKDDPYCLLDMEASWADYMKTIPLTEVQMSAIQLVTSPKVSIDDKILPRAIRRGAEELLQRGYLVECDKEDGLKDYQKYTLSSGRKHHFLTWSITSKCNMKCRHCYVSCGENVGQDVSMEQCDEVIRQMKEANIYQMALSGGEPFVHSHFWEIVDKLQENHISITQIFSNGLALTDKCIARMKEKNIGTHCMLISFDGIGAHDWMRGMAGVEGKVIDAIKRLKMNGFSVLVSSCFHGGSLDSILPTYELMKELSVDNWRVSMVKNSGSWKKHYTDNEKMIVNKQAEYDIYMDLLKKYKEDNYPMTLKIGGFFAAEKGDFNSGRIPFVHKCDCLNRDKEFLCGHVRLSTHLLDDGKLIPCLPMSGLEMDKIAPNIFEPGWSISRALDDSQIEKYLSCTYGELYEKNKKCRECEYRLKCNSCRASALEATGDFFGCDEAVCYFMRSGYEEKIKNLMGWNDEG